jgi:EamA domain-containing membrane protein RarD
MRKFLLIIAIVLTILSVIFSILHLDTLALAPIGLALIFIFLAFKKSNSAQRKTTKMLFAIAYICALIVIGKTYLIKDKVAIDKVLEKQKVESKKEDIKDLEGLE